MKYSQRWRQTTFANRLLVISSFLMAVGTFCLAVASFYHYRTFQAQLTMMQVQAEAARESAVIAADQSQAVKDSAKAAKDSSAAASMLTEQNKELIAAARTQANAAETTASSAAQSLQTARRSMIVGSRAYIGVNNIQTDLKRGQITFWLENIEKVPATNLKVSAGTALPKNAHGSEGFAVLLDKLLDLEANDLYPGPFKLPVLIWIRDFIPETEPLILSRQRVLYATCKIEYDNGFERKSESNFLFYYLPPPDDKWIPRGLVRTAKK